MRSVDCVTKSSCSTDFCDPFFRRCFSISGGPSCHNGTLVETTREALLHKVEQPGVVLNLTEKLLIVSEAQRFFRDIHAHRHFHLGYLGVDPAQMLRVYAKELRDTSSRSSTSDFHQRMIALFQLARDGHSVYNVPPPLGRAIAFLPLQVREYHDGSDLRFVVTDVAINPNLSKNTLKIGAEVIRWNGLPVHEAALQTGNEAYTTHKAARLSFGLKLMTFRYLSRDRVPTQDAVTMTYRTRSGGERTIRMPWRYAPYNPFAKLHRAGAGLARGTVKVGKERTRSRSRTATTKGDSCKHLSREIVVTPLGSFGKITVPNFNDCGYQEFLHQFHTSLLSFPSNDGVVIDVRGNNGGDPRQCVGAARYFADNRILGTTLQSRVSALNLHLARLDRAKRVPNFLYLRAMFRAQTRTENFAKVYDLNYFGDLSLAEDIKTESKPRYNGPVVVLVDSETFSCGEVFTSAVQDSGSGIVVGTHKATSGGGGASLSNVLYSVMYPEYFSPLPGQVTFQITNARLVRTGKSIGMPFEFFGIQPDVRYNYTRVDRTRKERDLNLFLKNILRKKN